MNLLLKPRTRTLLTGPCNWNLICSLFEPDCMACKDPAHAAWLKLHRDAHQHREALFCLEGTVVCSLKQRLYKCRPGTLLLIDSNESHDLEYPPGTNAVHIWLTFIQNRILVKILSIDDGQISAIRPPILIHNPGLYNLLNQCWSSTKPSPLEEPLRHKRLTAIFSLLFIELLEADLIEATQPEDDQGRAASRHRNIIQLIEEHIRTTSGSGLSIDKLAKIAGYSKFHFLRLFKSVTGSTVHDHINMARLNKITEMEAQNAQQKEIAAALGFSSPSAFSHWRNSQNQGKN